MTVNAAVYVRLGWCVCVCLCVCVCVILFSVIIICNSVYMFTFNYYV